MSNGLPDIPIDAIAIDRKSAVAPSAGTSIYLGTDIGVYQSTDGGGTWAVFNPGNTLPVLPVFDMAFQEQMGASNPSRILRIATHGRGIWEIQTTPPSVTPTSVVSRMTHGSITMPPFFGITLPLPVGTMPRGVECRSSSSLGAGNYTMVFTFPNNLSSVASATVTGHDPMSGTGSVSSTAIGPNASLNLAANQYEVNLTNVSNAQYITVTLNSVVDMAGNSGDVLSPQMGVLIGDVNASGRVDSGDVFSVRQNTGQGATLSNFRNDVNASGRIDSGDVFAVRQQTGTGLPTPP
jgi:hypothetical protein